MWDLLPHVSVVIVLLLLKSVLLWPVVLDKIVHSPPLKSHRICHGRFLLLIDRIKHLESMYPNQLVIAINIEPNLVLPAILHGSLMQIRNRSSLHLIPNQGNPLTTHIVPLHVSLNIVASLVRRCIINNHNMIIIIILVKNTLQIELISEVSNVVVTRNYDAKRKLFLVFAYVVFLVQSFLFFLVCLLEFLELVFCCEWRFYVVLQ